MPRVFTFFLAVVFVVVIGLAPARAGKTDYTDFSALIRLEKWTVDHVSDNDWDWLCSKTSSHDLFANLCEKLDIEDEDRYYYFHIIVRSTNDDNLVAEGSAAGDEIVYPLISEGSGDYSYLSEMYGSLDDLYDEHPAGAYVVTVSFEDDATREASLALPDYRALEPEEPSLELDYDGNTLDRIVLSWPKDVAADAYSFDIFKPSGASTTSLFASPRAANGSTEATLQTNNLDFADETTYFIAGTIYNDKDNAGNQLQGHEFNSVTYRVHTQGKDDEYNNSNDDLDDSGSVFGCAMNASPARGGSLGAADLLLLVSGLVLARLVRRGGAGARVHARV